MPETLAFPVTPNIGATANLVIHLEALGIDPNDFITALLDRHFRGDWGDLDAEDKRANEQALKYGSRILSRYNEHTLSIYVITDAAVNGVRQTTTVMLVSDY